MKEAQMTIRIEPELLAEFANAALQEHRPASQVLRELMRAYVGQIRARSVKPENDAMSAEERRRREGAARFALSSVSLEGFKPSLESETQMQRFINGEIELVEFMSTGSETTLGR